MAEFSLAALAAELNTDPTGIGYAALGWPNNDQAVVDALNAPIPGETVTRKRVDPLELLSSIPLAEWEAVSDARRQYLNSLIGVSGATIDATDPVVWANLLDLFGVGTDSRANIQAKVQRDGSRAEVLWGEGTVVSVSQVARAANL